jgi:hypothetical protein
MDLLPIVRAAGCDGETLPLDEAGLRRIGLDGYAGRAHICAGAQSLRALLIDLTSDADTPRALGDMAARLTRRAPARLWLLVAHGRAMTIAAWSGGATRPRVAALRVDAARVRRSDAEAVAQLAASGGGIDVLVHARWQEILGRDAITGRFYRALATIVRRMAGEAPPRVPPDDRRTLALLHVTRLLFLSYLEAKGWLDGDPRFLARAFERFGGAGGFQRRVLSPLFFGTLNTPPARRAPAARALGRIPFLNGGLFARTSLERRHAIAFSDDSFGELFDTVLLRYRFTPREEQPDWAEAAVDPEMLGRAFESLMVAERRRDTGAFYTPLALVSQLVDRGLAIALRGCGAREREIARVIEGRQVGDAAAAALRRRLTTLTVLDPACGSGAFLVHALERIAGLLEALGDRRGAGTIRRSVLARSIFGVDVDSTAVWLCELRLWLATVVRHDSDDPMTVPPLPNLDRQIRVGDSLGGELPATAWRQPGGARVARLRERYARASGARKRSLGRSLERAERQRAIARVERECEAACAERRELAAALRARDLFGERRAIAPDERRRLVELRARIRALRADHRRLRDGGALPFAWSVHAADILDAGGFDLVVGNPPWVRLHRIPIADRVTLRSRFETFAHAGWRRGMELARAGRGFAGQVDLSALFVERGLALGRDGGALAYLLPAKLWRSLSGGGVRRLLSRRAALELVEDWSAGPTLFDAAVYPSAIVARIGTPDDGAVGPRRCLEIAEHRHESREAWRTARGSLSLTPADAASPWLLLPPEARRSFALLGERGTALADSHFGPPTLGVKTGCNEAFVVMLRSAGPELSEIATEGRTGVVETALLRPLLRGESLVAAAPDDTARLIWTHDETGTPMRRLPRHAARWLAPHEARLRVRADLRGNAPWWSLFRTASARPDRARLVWADVAREPRLRVLSPGDPSVPLNSCYVLPCSSLDDATALAALLRAPSSAAWLAALAEPARGGYRRYLAWTVALLPIPRDWPRALAVLLRVPGDATERQWTLAAADAFELPPDALLPLIAWSRR